jgi:hypothetical protein
LIVHTKCWLALCAKYIKHFQMFPFFLLIPYLFFLIVLCIIFFIYFVMNFTDSRTKICNDMKFNGNKIILNLGSTGRVSI